MNVAITRAKRCLFIVGSALALRVDPNWSALMSSLQSRDCILSGDAINQTLAQAQAPANVSTDCAENVSVHTSEESKPSADVHMSVATNSSEVLGQAGRQRNLDQWEAAATTQKESQHTVVSTINEVRSDNNGRKSDPQNDLKADSIHSKQNTVPSTHKAVPTDIRLGPNSLDVSHSQDKENILGKRAASSPKSASYSIPRKRR